MYPIHRPNYLTLILRVAINDIGLALRQVPTGPSAVTVVRFAIA